MTTNVALTKLDIDSPDGSCDAHLAIPQGDGPFPGVLFFMDAFGLRTVTDEWIKRIAAFGYVVLSPNMLFRYRHLPKGSRRTSPH